MLKPLKISKKIVKQLQFLSALCPGSLEHNVSPQTYTTTASPGQKKLMQKEVKQFQVSLLVGGSFFGLTVQPEAGAVAVSECKSIAWPDVEWQERGAAVRGEGSIPRTPAGTKQGEALFARCSSAWLPKSTC